MKLNDAQRGYARKHLGVPDTADDAAIGQVIGTALMEERIAPAIWQQLKDNKPVDSKAVVGQIIDERLDQRLGTFKDTLICEIKGILVPPAGQGTNPSPGQKDGNGASSGGGQQGGQGGQGGTGAGTGTPPPNPPQPWDKDLDDKLNQRLSAMGLPVAGPAADGQGGTVSPTALLSRSAQNNWLSDSGNIRVKSPIERFDRTRKEARYPENCKHVDLRNQRVTFPDELPGGGRPLDFASQADKAIAGAWFKWQINLTNPGGELPRWTRMTDLDYQLVNYSLHEVPFTGMVGGVDGTPVDGAKLADVHYRGVDGVKAILDDSTSGGINAAPIVIEDQLILIPLLYGELFPRIPVINLTRGRRVHAATMGTPTFTPGIAEGTPIPLFDTTNFLGTFDTQVYPAVGAMEIGQDFEEDTPADIGGTVIKRYGEAALQYLDMVPALGDGVTQPLGIGNASGITIVAAANGITGPLTVADAEALMFGINKAYRNARAGNNVFIGNEVAYRRFRSVPLGSTWANSRAFGADYASYQILGSPFAIIPTMPNNWVIFGNLAFYRMYRRLGLTVRVETAGKTLALANTKLIVVRMRYGGQPEQGGAFAVMTDAPL